MKKYISFALCFFLAFSVFAQEKNTSNTSKRMKALNELTPNLSLSESDILLIIRGVDLNNNGVKDSVEEFLKLKYEKLSAEKEIINFAAAKQKILEVNYDDKYSLVSAYFAGNLANRCLMKKVGKDSFRDINLDVSLRTYETTVSKVLLGVYAEEIQRIQKLSFSYDDGFCEI
ncbi:hypothetical protein [Comamonas sp. E6]|uniref:hypothetical protein n=1 Tax=Comamonas sp. E6 TaxID=364029 RepID=UPI000636289F|nr:hypothetical protein [Comamonas sp. E6]GAO71041.1 hypothetical protein CSE6_013_24780 [Comamonas sp. E6]